jgi:3-oxoacyl-[acyl-carrier protein] reductase
MRSVVVTGGSRGLGLGIARALGGVGYRVIAIARRQSDQLAAAMREAGGDQGSLHFWAFDLAQVGDISALVKAIRKEFGPIYGLINNAAIGASGILATMHDEQIDQALRLNTLSPIVLTKYVMRAMMVDGGGGRIINIASIVSTTGFSGLSVYGATKASLTGFTRSLAREAGRLGITVNAVAPGFVDTEMTKDLEGAQRDQILRRSPLHRLADVDDVANAVEFLLSDRAKNITGTVLTVDAGSTA